MALLWLVLGRVTMFQKALHTFFITKIRRTLPKDTNYFHL